jgi:membrane protein
MARLRDVSQIVRKIGPLTFAKRVWQQVGEDNVFTWGSALAYSWMFAVFPFLVFLLSLIPLIPEQYKPSVREQVAKFVDQSIPSEDAASILKGQIGAVLDKPSAGGFLSFGLILALWAASGGMSMTMTALDKAYDIEKGRSFFKQRLVAAGLTLSVATLAILVMALLPLGTGVLAWLSKHAPETGIPISGWILALIDLARYAVALALLLGITALIYHFGPNLKQKFHAVTPGAIFCIAMWLLLGLGFRLYLSKFGGAESYNKTYGAVAGLVILLLLFYLDALVLLVGAEINSELDFAAAGLPSGKTAEEKAVAPIPTEENKALAEELKRVSSAPKQALADSSPPETAPPAETRHRGLGQILLGLVAVLVAGKTARKMASRPKVISRGDGVASPDSSFVRTRRLVAEDDVEQACREEVRR